MVSLDADRASLMGRAALALLLAAGFYALAFAILAGLGFIIYLEATSESLSIGITIIAGLGIVGIVGGIVPRHRRFVEPGPRVTSDDQPRLFQEISRVADETKSPMPHDVYIGADLNAGVAHIGGFAGIGARPVMVVGLPLIAALTVSELRGVLAHEFGHYVGGETKLAPVIYRTREAIGGTVISLARSPHWLTRLLFVPFHLYGLMYLRTTQAISRRQELDADVMAARVAGAGSAESGLVKVHAAGLTVDAYLNELSVLLAAGCRPPIAAGFSRFLDGRQVADALQDADETLREHGSDPYDSHPSLKERLAALSGAPARPAPAPDPTATELLRDEPGLEVELLSRITQFDVPSLRPISWDEVSSVWLDLWRQRCRDERTTLEGITPGTLPLVCQDSAAYASRVRHPDPAARLDILGSLVGAALTVVLSRSGWMIDAGPGDPVTATLDDEVIMPFEVMHRLTDGELLPEEWLRTCHGAGIADIDLGMRDSKGMPSSSRRPPERTCLMRRSSRRSGSSRQRYTVPGSRTMSEPSPHGRSRSSVPGN